MLSGTQLKSFEKKLERALDIVTRSVDQYEIPALSDLRGAMMVRIHKKGKDTEGKPIGINSKNKGKYSKSYEKYRLKMGRQVGYIDLELKGDMRRGFSLGKEKDQNVLKFQNEKEAKKAFANEKRFNAEIYKPSEQELDDLKEIYLLQVKKTMKKAFSSQF